MRDATRCFWPSSGLILREAQATIELLIGWEVPVECQECILRHFLPSFHVATRTPLSWARELEDEDKLFQAVHGMARIGEGVLPEMRSLCILHDAVALWPITA